MLSIGMHYVEIVTGKTGIVEEITLYDVNKNFFGLHPFTLDVKQLRIATSHSEFLCLENLPQYFPKL